MTRTIIAAAAAALMTVGLSASAQAAPCHDAKGKFIKCPPAAATKPVRCKDAKGKFAKCGTPGATPVK